MNDDEIALERADFRAGRSAEPLPAQLKRTEISRQLRAVFGFYIYGELQGHGRRDTWTYVGDSLADRSKERARLPFPPAGR